MDDNLLLIGRVVKPHGVRGRVRVISYAASIETFTNTKTLYWKEKVGPAHSVSIKSAVAQSGGVVLSFSEIDSRDKAEEMRGCDLFIDKADLKKLPEDEYYLHELIGLDVNTADDRHLGVIRDIFQAGSNDVFVTRKGKEEHLIPAIKDVVKKIDFDAGKVIVDTFNLESDEE